jgi:hypothetical protein
MGDAHCTSASIDTYKTLFFRFWLEFNQCPYERQEVTKYMLVKMIFSYAQLASNLFSRMLRQRVTISAHAQPMSNKFRACSANE